MKKTIKNLFIGAAIIGIGATILKRGKNKKKKVNDEYNMEEVEEVKRNYINLTEIAFNKVKDLEEEKKRLEEEKEEKVLYKKSS